MAFSPLRRIYILLKSLPVVYLNPRLAASSLDAVCHYTATLKCTKMSKRIYVRLGVMKSSIKSKQAKVGRAKAKQAMGWPPLAQSNSLSGYVASAVKTGGHLLSETPSPGILVDTKLSRGKNNILVLDELGWAGLGWARLGRALGAGRWAKLG